MIDLFTPPEGVWSELTRCLGDMPVILQDARLVAERAHKGQMRAEGMPYVAHPLRTALILADERKLPVTTLLVTGILHDVVEDSEITITYLEEEFGPTIANWVHWVTKPPLVGTQSKAERDAAYFARLRGGPEGARLVKFADRLDNLRCLPLREDPTRIASYRAETREWVLPIARQTDAWFAHELEALLVHP